VVDNIELTDQEQWICWKVLDGYELGTSHDGGAQFELLL
jgi:hypothetical protein